MKKYFGWLIDLFAASFGVICTINAGDSTKLATEYEKQGTFLSGAHAIHARRYAEDAETLAGMAFGFIIFRRTVSYLWRILKD